MKGAVVWLRVVRWGCSQQLRGADWEFVSAFTVNVWHTSGKYAEVMRAKCLEAYRRAQGSSRAAHDHVKDY